MTSASPAATLRRDLRALNADGGFCSFVIGVGETYIPAFAVAVGFGSLAVGMIATVPMLTGAMLQLAAPHGLVRLGSLRRWVVACVTVQALSFLPLVLAAGTGYAPAWLVYLAATAYWASGMSAGGAWNMWITQIIPQRIRSTFFGKRNFLCQLCTLGGLLLGGLTLQAAEHRGQALPAFAVLFTLAFLGRLTSSRCVAAQSEPADSLHAYRLVRLPELLHRLRTGSEMRFIVYLVTMQTASQLATPYFTPFMLIELKLSYAHYMALIAVSFVAKGLASPYLGRIAFRYGPRRLLWIGGIGIVPLAIGWMASPSFAYLLMLQTAAGVFWGAHELASLFLTFEAIRPEERTSVLALYNLLNAMATAGGAVLGGHILRGFGDDWQAYFILFALSTVCRGGVLLTLLRTPIPELTPRPMAVSVEAVRPALGSIDRPILSSLEEPPSVDMPPPERRENGLPRPPT